MERTSLFIINTPFQALCTIEAIKDYDIKNYYIAIVRNVNDKFNKKTEKILNDFNISFNFIFIKSFYDTLKKGILRKFDSELYNLNIDRIFVGDYYSDSFRLFITFFIKNEVNIILLDDGSATILLYKYGLSHIKLKSTNVIIKRKLINFLMLFHTKKNILFFSVFTPPNNYNILFKKNSLTFLRNNKYNDKMSFIIGSKMSETGKLSENEYFNYLNKIKARFPNETFFYCPHRKESTEKLNKIKVLFNFEIFNTEYTLEYDIYKKNIMPKIIVGFGSTAVYTLKIIFPNIDAYTISFYNKKTYNVYKVLNDVYKKQGVKILE